MTDGYIPTVFCDEICPPTRQHPDDWIIDREGNYWFDDEDWDRYEISAGPNDFMHFEDFGEAILTIHQDRTWSVSRDMPGEATHVCVLGDSDTLSSTIEEMVNGEMAVIGAGEYEIAYYAWHDEVWSFDPVTKRFTRGAA